jgi:hypothetical protein
VISDFSDQPIASGWKVFDTATGDLITSIPSDEEWGNNFIRQVDPVQWKLYRLEQSDSNEVVGDAPKQARLIAIDLDSGSELRELALPDVLIGSWKDASAPLDPHTGQPVLHYLNPGLALSADGRQLAVVHADENVVTLMDASDLSIERTLSLKAKTGLFDHLFSFVLLAPATASAKAPVVGATISATYSADGDYLYLGGTDVIPGDLQSNQEGRGLRVVSLSDGEYRAQAFDGFEVNQIFPLANGQIYLTGIDWGAASKSDQPYVIARLDGKTLKPLAIRAFPIFMWFYFLPAT